MSALKSGLLNGQDHVIVTADFKGGEAEIFAMAKTIGAFDAGEIEDEAGDDKCRVAFGEEKPGWHSHDDLTAKLRDMRSK